MKLVIDISEEIYKRAVDYIPELRDGVWNAIANGIPLTDVKKDIEQYCTYSHCINRINKNAVVIPWEDIESVLNKYIEEDK